ncbi:lipocalin family protein [Myroides odoratimimus]|uniref:lipocalin family protein n=1 Tax=Myroides odoratimimus TaxID=76832 RepID=UPI00046ACA36|nr:lipocalin family protein [Myroides odoratimimus]
MKKIFLFVVMTVMGVSTMACSSDDNSSTPDYKSSIQGTWKDSKIIYLDKDRKVLGETPASDNNDCGIDEIEFKGEAYTLFSSFKNVQNVCESEISKTKFNLKGNLVIIGSEDDLEEYEIVELTGKKLVLLDLDKITESGVEGEGWPKGTVYIQSEYVKK